MNAATAVPAPRRLETRVLGQGYGEGASHGVYHAGQIQLIKRLRAVHEEH
jgi:hypothetical protein